jgi:hypothetical protein
MPRFGPAGLVCLTIVAAFQVRLAAAGEVSQDVPLPGGTAAVAQALGLAASPDRARFVAELARLTYPSTESNQTTRARIANSWRALRDRAREGSDTVPIPLTASIWSQAVFRKAIAPADLVGTILSDPRSAHLCYGLAGSDDETLQFFAEHPDVITWLHENAAATFAAFGGSFRVRNNRVVVPGGPEAEVLWGSVVSEKLDRPDLFVRALFSEDQGRLAYLYDTVAELDHPRAIFALGLWTKDPSERLARFKALINVARSSIPQWQPAKFPFSRPPFDLANILERIRVEANGTPSFPAARAMWNWVVDGFDVPADAPRLSAHPDDGLVDAAWLAQALLSDDVMLRNDRLDQLAFGQRVFATVPAGALSDALVAIRAFPRYRMLMLSLERMGIRTPSVYATAARRAQQLASLEERRQLLALQQFQGALVVVWRLAAVRTLDAAACERLAVSLSAIAPSTDGRYAGAVAAWMDRDLRAALVAADVRVEAPNSDDGRVVPFTSQDDLEPALVFALAGSRAGHPSPAGGHVLWEGQVYRLDFVEAEAHRLQRIREKQSGTRVDVGLVLARFAKSLGGGRATPDEVAKAAGDLKNLVLDVAQGPETAMLRDTIAHAANELSKAGSRPDAQRLSALAAPLADAADEALADALMNWAYAIAIPDADSSVLLTGSVTRRHDFGVAAVPRRVRLSSEWALPRPRISVGVPWHINGSLLGLDVALSTQALRRVDGNRVVDAPSLSTNEREAFAQGVALLDPLKLTDHDRDVLVDAIASGRSRVASIAQNPAALEAIVSEIRMDGWRRRALRWTVAHEPERIESLFSQTELLLLGGAAGVNLDAWGMSGVESSGCVCTLLAPPNQWRMLIGRPQYGLMASAVPDLTLHVAAVLRELRLPAAISKAVLTAAVQDFIDEVRPTDANDWLTLVRAARTPPRERIEDYVAATTADGPLVPNTPEPVQ